MARSPLFAIHQALGATFTEVEGWELPQHFGAPEAEYWAVRHGVGLCDLSYRGVIRMTGKDRQRFLHAMVSNDTARLQPGQGCHATFLTNKGKLIADFVVYAETDAYLLDCEPQAVAPLMAGLEWFVISEDVGLQDDSAQWGLLSLQGPQSTPLLTRACGHPIAALPEYSYDLCILGGQQARLLRRSHTGAVGYQILAPWAELPEIWQALWVHRAAYGVQPVGMAALEILRIEAGIPLYGRDMTDDTIPVEANLNDAISYTKGCYIGQEVIARIDARGHVNRKLVGLLLSGPEVPASGATIVTPEREVGWITSAALSPRYQQPVALGYVRREVWEPGTPLTILNHGATMTATVMALPLYSGENGSS
jgi:glycine cleavage system T protein